MSSRTERPVSKIAATTMFYVLALGAGVMRTLSVAADYVAIGIHETLYPGLGIDTFVFGFASQWISFATTFTAVAVLSIRRQHAGAKRPLGFSLDPDFGRLRILPRKPMMYIALSGFFAGISTSAYYYLIGSEGADTVLPFGQLVIIYLLIGDLMAEKDTPTIVEIQCIISILFGVLIVGVETEGPGFNLGTLAIVLIPMNLSSAMTTYYQKKVKKLEIEPGLAVDTLNLRLWSLLVLNTVFSITAIPMAAPSAWMTLADIANALWAPMVAGSLATMFSVVMYVRALARGSMAVVNSLSAISVVLGIPVAIISGLLFPPYLWVDWATLQWILKIFGVILVIVGIIALEASDVRTIMIIKVKPETGDLLPQLFAVKGVESVSALAGEHDYLLSVKSRSLAKTRKLIVRKLEEIQGVQTINTLVVLKEYR